MDWKVFSTTFVMIFIAELGDKTQFAAMASSASTDSTISVLLAVVLALSLAGIIGVVAGRLMGSMLSPEVVRWVSGVLFICIGIWVLAKR